eukprot:TRINITY_DN292_c0_g1_i1.p1 TRINITY_DN292_c0_g1~~TRINITY_DN292_c0_g1_i1.p1  ORF type:complete len:556 (-),score=163.75 TRINITY_DN292_c0_g1_i1:31-1698(-)
MDASQIAKEIESIRYYSLNTVRICLKKWQKHVVEKKEKRKVVKEQYLKMLNGYGKALNKRQRLKYAFNHLIKLYDNRMNELFQKEIAEHHYCCKAAKDCFQVLINNVKIEQRERQLNEAGQKLSYSFFVKEPFLFWFKARSAKKIYQIQVCIFTLNKWQVYSKQMKEKNEKLELLAKTFESVHYKSVASTYFNFWDNYTTSYQLSQQHDKYLLAKEGISGFKRLLTRKRLLLKVFEENRPNSFDLLVLNHYFDRWKELSEKKIVERQNLVKANTFATVKLFKVAFQSFKDVLNEKRQIESKRIKALKLKANHRRLVVFSLLMKKYVLINKEVHRIRVKNAKDTFPDENDSDVSALLDIVARWMRFAKKSTERDLGINIGGLVYKQFTDITKAYNYNSKLPSLINQSSLIAPLFGLDEQNQMVNRTELLPGQKMQAKLILSRNKLDVSDDVNSLTFPTPQNSFESLNNDVGIGNQFNVMELKQRIEQLKELLLMKEELFKKQKKIENLLKLKAIEDDLSKKLQHSLYLIQEKLKKIQQKIDFEAPILKQAKKNLNF